MIFSENRYPPRIKCGAGFFGIMLARPGEWHENRSLWRKPSPDQGAPRPQRKPAEVLVGEKGGRIEAAFIPGVVPG